MITLNDCTLPRNLGLQACNFIKKRLWHKCFPVNFAKFLGTPFSQSTSGRLLLTIPQLLGYSTYIVLNETRRWKTPEPSSEYLICVQFVFCALGVVLLVLVAFVFSFCFFWKLLIILNFKDTCKAYHKRLFANVMLL